MLVKGKAPKVLIAAATQEPVIDIPEGRRAERPATQGLYGQSLTAQQVESLHYFSHGDGYRYHHVNQS